MNWPDDYHNQLIGGDCLEIMDTMPAGCVDLMVTDPPYFLPAAHYNTRRQFRRNFADLGILEHFFRDFFTKAVRVLKDTASLYIFCDGQSYPLFYFYCYPFCKSVKPIIWDKKTSINGYGWRHQHEIILWAELPKVKPIPTGDGDIIRCSAVPVETRAHPAQKPVELVATLISKSSQPGDIIFDPFAGAGTTFKACRDLDRIFVGCDLDPSYCQIDGTIIRQGVLNLGIGS